MANGSVVARWAIPRPASYVLVGTPLPLTAPARAALRGEKIVFFTIWSHPPAGIEASDLLDRGGAYAAGSTAVNGRRTGQTT